mgnify:FL=1
MVLAAALLVCAIVRPVRAQLFEPLPPNLPEMATDRDAFTPATTSVVPGLSILEASYSYIDNREQPDVNSFPEALLRYGLSERVELRIGWNYEAGGGGNVVTANESSEGLLDGSISYESHAMYGVKVDLTEQSGWMPRSAAILEGFTPTSGPEPASQPVCTVVAGWELPKQWRFDYALRYAMGNERKDAYNRWGPSAILRMHLSDEWHAHLEWFGVFSEGFFEDTSRAFISPGVHYNFSPNFEVGLRMGWGVSPDAANYFVNWGFGWRY